MPGLWGGFVPLGTKSLSTTTPGGDAMRSITRKPGALIGALAVGLIMSVPAQANHNEDDHSDNVKHLAQLPISLGKDVRGQGSDLAFKGKKVYAGSYQGTV